MLEKHLGEVAHGRGVPAEQVFAEVKAGIPLGDFTLPADIAAAISFLASDESRQITGLELIVDGGLINCNTFRPENRSPKPETLMMKGRGHIGIAMWNCLAGDECAVP